MTPLLASELEHVTVEGSIDEIEPVEKRIKFVLSQLSIEGMPPEQTPRRLRVSFREHDLDGLDLRIGSRIRMNAMLFPLPQPVMPGSYDFARHFYFRGIGGNGYAVHPPEMIGSTQTGIAEWFGNLRHRIGDDMRAHMPGATGTVAAAMTVGETGSSPEDTKNTLRDAGLAHMLAIAGLHLSIKAGVVFFCVRLLLTLYPPLAIRINAKKIAAVCAMFTMLFYLFLAGSPIPAQRAFIMLLIFFLAMLLDRRGISLRTLSMAAIFILLIFPEAMSGASFQLSFAATLAIISLYEPGRAYINHSSHGWRGRLFRETVGIALTSLAATLATMPFIIYNFNRFALFGLIANMIVIPLATFIIMPGMVLALLLMPLGLQAIGYVPLEFGTRLMLNMASWVTSIPYASLHLPSPSDMGLTACAFGLMWLCLMTQKWRLLGIPVIALGLSTMAFHVSPDVLISNDMRQVMARTPEGEYTMLKGAARSFVAQSWLRAEGKDDVVPVKETDIECDKVSCDYRRDSYRILLLKKPSEEEALKELCAQKADVLIAWDYISRDNCSCSCDVDRPWQRWKPNGAYELWLNPEGIKVMRAQERKDDRLWHR